MRPQAKTNLSVAQVISEVSYDPSTGQFMKASGGGRASQYRMKHGHVVVCLSYGRYSGHRLAWLIHYGEWPSGDVDHINGDPTDNRIQNLRSVSHAVNLQNQRAPHRNNRGGFLGAYFDSTRARPKKWKAQLSVSGRTKSIGWFLTGEEAHAAYVEAKRKLHEGCTL